MLRTFMILIGTGVFLAGCAAKEVEQQATAENTRPKSDIASEAKPATFEEIKSACLAAYEPLALGQPVRYLSSLDGDYQSGYEPPRNPANEAMDKIERKGPPDIKDVEAYASYLSVLDSKGKYAEFEKRIKPFAAQNPGDKRIQFLLAVHALRQKKTELASYFLRQLEKDELFVWRSLVLNNLAMLALQEGNRNLAIEYLEKAVKSQPPAAAPHANLGALYLQTRSYDRAEKMFRRAYEIDEDFEDAAVGLGVALEGQDKHEEAHKIYEAYMKRHPGALSVAYNDAIILGNRLGKKEEAAQLMLRYIQRGGKETARAHEIIKSWR